jgi:hypothetical protein
MKAIRKWFLRAIFAFMFLRWLVLFYVMATDPQPVPAGLFLIVFAVGMGWFGGLWFFFRRVLPAARRRWKQLRAPEDALARTA